MDLRFLDAPDSRPQPAKDTVRAFIWELYNCQAETLPDVDEHDAGQVDAWMTEAAAGGVFTNLEVSEQLEIIWNHPGKPMLRRPSVIS